MLGSFRRILNGDSLELYEKCILTLPLHLPLPSSNFREERLTFSGIHIRSYLENFSIESGFGMQEDQNEEVYNRAVKLLQTYCEVQRAPKLETRTTGRRRMG